MGGRAGESQGRRVEGCKKNRKMSNLKTHHLPDV